MLFYILKLYYYYLLLYKPFFYWYDQQHTNIPMTGAVERLCMLQIGQPMHIVQKTKQTCTSIDSCICCSDAQA